MNAVDFSTSVSRRYLKSHIKFSKIEKGHPTQLPTALLQEGSATYPRIMVVLFATGLVEGPPETGWRLAGQSGVSSWVWGVVM